MTNHAEVDRQLHLAVNYNSGAGLHSAAWRALQQPQDFFNIDALTRVAQIAESAAFDAIFLSDVPSVLSMPPRDAWHVLEPTLALAAIAANRSGIGLIATLSTTFNEPYNVARRLASLDHLSGGRAAWNVVTTFKDLAAANFLGDAPLPDPATRYARANEFVEVVLKLWDSWEPDALLADHGTGVFVDPQRVHPIEHVGDNFAVRGPLQVPRAPQGRPVLVQAGISKEGRELAARYGEVIFTLEGVFDHATKFYRETKSRAESYGRSSEDVVILPGLLVILGGTEEEALAKRSSLDELLDMDHEVRKVGQRIGLELSEHDLDRKILSLRSKATDGLWGLGTQASAWRFAEANPDLTVREFVLRSGASHNEIAGTPEQVADHIERWFVERAADGFNLSFLSLPGDLEPFVDHVVPDLRRRGLYRDDYQGATLREHLDLPTPRNQYQLAARGTPALA